MQTQAGPTRWHLWESQLKPSTCSLLWKAVAAAMVCTSAEYRQPCEGVWGLRMTWPGEEPLHSKFPAPKPTGTHKIPCHVALCLISSHINLGNSDHKSGRKGTQ